MFLVRRSSIARLSPPELVRHLYHGTHSDEIQRLLLTVPQSTDSTTSHMLDQLLPKLDSSQRSLVCDKILKLLKPSTKNRKVLITSLQNLRVEDASFETVFNLIHIMNLLGASKKRNLSEAQWITQFFAAYYDRNPKVMHAIQRGMKGAENHANRNLLLVLLLRGGQAHQVFYMVLEWARDGIRVRGPTLEMLLIHLAHMESLDKVSEILRLAERLNYDIYSRTYAEIFSKAISLGDSEFCLRHLTKMLDHTFIDNGSLVALAELLVDKISAGDMGLIYSIGTNKGSFTSDLHGRLRRCVVENLAHTYGFRRAWSFLRLTHTKGMLRVIDYPVLLNKFQSTRHDRKAGYLMRMNRNEVPELKAFYLSLGIAKNAIEGRLESFATLIIQNPRILRYMNEESLWQLLCGLRKAARDHEVDLILNIVEASTLNIRTSNTINLLTRITLDSTYWFRVFNVVKLIKVPQYKFPPTIASRLLALSKEHGIVTDSIQPYM